jgi:hypothetical protein
VLADGFTEWEGLMASIEAQLTGMPQIRGGVSLVGDRGCLVRLFTSAADLALAQARLWAQARELVMGLAPFDLRKY